MFVTTFDRPQMVLDEYTINEVKLNCTLIGG